MIRILSPTWIFSLAMGYTHQSCASRPCIRLYRRSLLSATRRATFFRLARAARQTISRSRGEGNQCLFADEKGKLLIAGADLYEALDGFPMVARTRPWVDVGLVNSNPVLGHPIARGVATCSKGSVRKIEIARLCSGRCTVILLGICRVELCKRIKRTSLLQAECLSAGTGLGQESWISRCPPRPAQYSIGFGARRRRRVLSL